jgi:hypothetical protein
LAPKPRAVDASSSHQFEEEIGDASSENDLSMAKMEFSIRTPGHASRSDSLRKFLLLRGIGLRALDEEGLELVDENLGYLGAKLSALPLVMSPYHSKHVARKVDAGHSSLGALCNVTLQRSCERGLFSHSHLPLGALRNVTRNPLYRVATWDVAMRHRNDTAPYKELSQKGILCT